MQALALLAFAADVSLPVTATFLTGSPGAGGYDSASLGSLRIDWLVAAFLLLAAIDLLTLSAGRPRRWYEANVARGINPARWWEYSLSASLMVVLISMLAGVTELVAATIAAAEALEAAHVRAPGRRDAPGGRFCEEAAPTAAAG